MISHYHTAATISVTAAAAAAAATTTTKIKIIMIIIIKSDLELINTKKRRLEFCRSNRPQSENEKKRKDKQIFGLCKRTKKAVEYEGGDSVNC